MNDLIVAGLVTIAIFNGGIAGANIKAGRYGSAGASIACSAAMLIALGVVLAKSVFT